LTVDDAIFSARDVDFFIAISFVNLAVRSLSAFSFLCFAVNGAASETSPNDVVADAPASNLAFFHRVRCAAAIFFLDSTLLRVPTREAANDTLAAARVPARFAASSSTSSTSPARGTTASDPPSARIISGNFIDSVARCFRTPSASPRCTSFRGRPRRSPSVPARRLCAAPLLGVPRLARARVDVDIDIDIDDAIPRVVVVDARRRLSRPTPDDLVPWDRSRADKS
jgi:hypothetical protein